MKKTALILLLSLFPVLSFAGLQGGPSECSQSSSYRDVFKITLEDLASSMNLSPYDFFSKDSHFHNGLTASEQKKNILGEGKSGSYKTTVLIEHSCRSLNGGRRMTLTFPSSFQPKILKKLTGQSSENRVVDTHISQNIQNNELVYDGKTLELLIDLSKASKTDLMKNGRRAENIYLSIYNVQTGLSLEGVHSN